MINKFLAALTALLLASMLFSCGVFSVGFILAGGIIPVMLGASLGILCLLGAWSLYQEINFGRMAEKISKNVNRRAAADEQLDANDKISCLNEPEQAEEKCKRWAETTALNSGVYDNWYYLASAYDEVGDRKKARAAMREAIQLYRTQAVSGL